MDGGSGLDALGSPMTDDDAGSAAEPPDDAVEPVFDLCGIVGCEQWLVPFSISLLTSHRVTSISGASAVISLQRQPLSDCRHVTPLPQI
jgi:hypothetical protein